MKNKVKIFCVFLLCIIISSTFMAYSKYKNSHNIKTSSKIAKPILEIVGVDEMQVDVLNEDKHYYEFSIRNFNQNNDVSDVELKYNIEFICSQENAPLIINLYRINNFEETKIELQKNKTIQYEYLELNKEENFYRAEIMYDNNSNVIMEDNLEIKLNIQSIQVEEESI